MRRSLYTIALGAALACASAPSALAGTGLRLTEAGQRHFPERSFVLAAPTGARFAPDQIDLRENGRRVAGLEAVSAKAAGDGQLGLVLLIDASGSMKGRPIQAAMRAAQALARHRNHEQPLAIVTFGSTSSLLLPFTTDERKIRRALSTTPRARRGTHVYDALSRAIRLIESQGVAAGSIVLLSDGADSGSRASVGEAAVLAKTAGARVFTVGLDSPALNSQALTRLADGAGGRYFRARNPEDLEAIYDELGEQLSSEYLLTYRSNAAPGLEAVVEARVEGVAGIARTAYLTPRKLRQADRSDTVSAGQGFWSSTLALLLVSFVCAAPLAVVVLGMGTRRRRTLRTRMADFVSMPQPGGAKRGVADPEGQLLTGAQKSLEKKPWWVRLEEELDVADIERPAIQVVAWIVIATLVAVFLLALVSGSALVAVLGLGLPVAARAVLKRKLEQQRKLFAEQLGENCEILASAMRAGHSLVGALSVVVDEAAEPSRTEFGRVVADERLGIPLETALAVVARRMESRDLPQVAIVAALQRDTGGSTAEVLDRVAEGIRSRFALRRLVATLTAQGRAARWVLTLLPLGLLLAMSIVNPGYLTPLFTTGVGHFLLVIGVAMVTAGSLAIKKIVDIKV